MDNQTVKIKKPILFLISNNLDLLIVFLAFVFSLLAYTFNPAFTLFGLSLSATGVLYALLPLKNLTLENKTTAIDERTTHIKYIAGFYAYMICTGGLFAIMIIAPFLHFSLAVERLPFIFLHMGLFIYTLMFTILRRTL